jgi:hypothetical protein
VSGYLRNLARRALRRTGVLHSVTTLPFATVPSMPLQEQESRVGLRAPARGAESESTARQARKDAASRPAQAEGARARRAPESAAVRRQPPELLVPRAADPPQRLPRPPELFIPLAVDPTQRLPRARPVAARAGNMLPTAGGVADESGRAATSDGPHDFVRDGSSPRPEATLPQASAVQVIAVPVRRAAPPAATSRPRPVSTAETATEVHLSIGRVEVAVLAQSSAPKESRPRVNHTMSLAEYERRRRERDR